MKVPIPKFMIAGAQPMLLISWAFGIGVIEYPLGRPRPVISAIWSIFNFLTYLGFLRMANFSDIVTFHGSLLAAYNYRTNAYLCAAFVATSLCLAQSRVKVLYEYRDQMEAMNDKLKMLGIPDDLEVAITKQLIQLSVAIIFTSIMMVLDFKCVGFDLPNEWSRFGFLTVAHYLLIFAFIVDSHFVSSIGYLGNRFQHLNKLLEDSDSAEKNKTIVTQESSDEFQRYSSVISEIYQNNFVAIRVAEKQWLIYVIRETRMIHRGLCKLAMTLNRACGIQLIFSVGLSVNMMAVLFYTSYDIAVSSSLSSLLRNNWTPKILTAMWITFYAMRIILIVNACDITSCEAKRTERLISKLLKTAACDEDIRDEISIFSLQLLKNPLNITANGFFILDYSLIHKIIGSVTTYLIIMIQMKRIYEPKNVDT